MDIVDGQSFRQCTSGQCAHFKYHTEYFECYGQKKTQSEVNGIGGWTMEKYYKFKQIILKLKKENYMEKVFSEQNWMMTSDWKRAIWNVDIGNCIQVLQVREVRGQHPVLLVQS